MLRKRCSWVRVCELTCSGELRGGSACEWMRLRSRSLKSRRKDAAAAATAAAPRVPATVTGSNANPLGRADRNFSKSCQSKTRPAFGCLPLIRDNATGEKTAPTGSEKYTISVMWWATNVAKESSARAPWSVGAGNFRYESCLVGFISCAQTYTYI